MGPGTVLGDKDTEIRVLDENRSLLLSPTNQE